MMYVGIDNGLKGGIVVVNRNKNIVEKFVMPTIKVNGKLTYDADELVRILSRYSIAKIMLEQSHVRPVSGKRACFMTGYGYGLIQGILKSLQLKYVIVSPQKWMNEMFGKSIKEYKWSTAYCNEMWPEEDWTATKRSKKMHDGLTDAACIAMYCYRINQNEKR